MALNEMYAGSNQSPFSNALSNFMQARQTAATNRLMAPAMSGDLSALNELMSYNPEAGMKVQQVIAGQQATQNQQRQQEFENKLAIDKFGLAERELEIMRNKSKASQLKSFQPQLMVNPDTGKPEMMVPIVDEATGIATWSPISGAGTLEVARETPEQQREREAASKVKTAGLSAGATKTAERDQEWIDKGVSSYDSLRDINRLIELNDVIASGGYSKAAVQLADAFGYTPADEGEFRSLQREMVIGRLKASMGGNPTESERSFLETTMADLGQGKEVNRRTLDRLKAINERQVNRAKAAADRQGISWEEYVGEPASGGTELQPWQSIQPGSEKPQIKFLGFE